jgi:N-alpha-acetyl-L-2,4-diaminobutyrate deacetylase
MMLREIDGAGMYDSAVEEMGKVFISTELGGGGTATARSIGIARRGVTNLLKHAGIVEGEPEIRPSVDIDTTVGNCFHFSENSGLLEPMVDLGEEVRAGAPIARIWPVDRSGTAPCIVEAQRDGILAARHFPGLIKTGDCLAVVAAVHS